MTLVKGMFITQSCRLMSLYKEAQTKAADYVKQRTGMGFDDLDPHGWFESDILNTALDIYVKSSPSGENALITMGKLIYPTWKKYVGLPDTLKTAEDYLVYENEGFLNAHKGEDIRPRRILSKKDREIIIDAKPPYDESCILIEGVFLGILEMIGIRTGHIEQLKCIRNGDDTCVYKIIW